MENSMHFKSHGYEPEIGDTIINSNPSCDHHKSVGVVLSIDSLPGNAGKTASYLCINSGTNWKKGDVLSKTLDQLSPFN